MDSGSVRIIGYKFKLLDDDSDVIKKGAGRLYINNGASLENNDVDSLVEEEILQRFEREKCEIDSLDMNITIVNDKISHMYQNKKCELKDSKLSKFIKPLPIFLVTIIGGYLMYRWISNSDVNIVKN